MTYSSDRQQDPTHSNLLIFLSYLSTKETTLNLTHSSLLDAVDHINSCCTVVHTKESYAEVVQIIQSEPPFTLHKVPSFVCFKQNRMFPDYIKRNSCVIRIIKSGLHQNLLVGGLHHTKHVCQLF